MTGINVIELVQTGFHGAAIAVLFFSAWLLRDYSQRVLAIEKDQQDFRIVEGVRKLIVTFMIMSGLFFVFGVGAQIYAAASARSAAAEVVPAVTDLQDYEHLQPTIFRGGITPPEPQPSTSVCHPRKPSRVKASAPAPRATVFSIEIRKLRSSEAATRP